jgi:hypothetical protein
LLVPERLFSIPLQGWGLGGVLPATPADPTIGADLFGREVSAR